MNRFVSFVFLLFLGFSHPAFALKCGHWLVELGDYKDDVYDKCGEPNYVQSHYETRASANQAQINQFNLNQIPNLSYGQSYYRGIEVLVEEWKYDFGSSRFHQLLRFENGRLVDIVSLDKNRHYRW